MPPVFGPLSPSKARLWSCAATSGSACSPSHSAKKLDLLAVQEFLDHDRGAGRAEAVARQHVARRLDRLLDGLGHDDALAGGEAVGLDHDRRALRLDIGRGLVGVGEALVGGGRDVVAPAQLLGEALASLRAGPPPATARTP